MNEYTSPHNLDFEAAPWEAALIVDEGFEKFRIGTCEGLWRSTAKSYEILAVINKTPGNGHFKDVLGWFEHSCKRDKKSLVISEVWNENFKQHLLKKQGFKREGPDNVIKQF